MPETDLPPGWPRMPIDEAIVALAKLWELSPTAAADSVSTAVEGRRFYPTAPTRVDKARLDRLRDAVLSLARRHGFPGARDLRASPTFDQELAALFADSVPMLPVEAADEEVWAFITLSVLPDVAIWRWPAQAGNPDRTLIEVGDETKTDSRTDRLLGRRRGVFRQAWWRGHLLGADACKVLDEDNFINLTDRVSLTGDRLHGNLITEAHVSRLGRPTYDRRFALRRALILIGREFGRLAVEALPEERVRDIIDAAFSRAEHDVAREQAAGKETRSAISRSPRTAEDGPEEGRVSPAEEPQTSAPAPDATARFMDAAGPYATVLTSMLVPVGYATAMAMLLRAEQHVRALGGDPIAARICDDLSDLVGDWAALADDQRSVVFAALTYFVEDDDVTADHDPDGLLDDDAVVDCAFTALGRERRLS